MKKMLWGILAAVSLTGWCGQIKSEFTEDPKLVSIEQPGKGDGIGFMQSSMKLISADGEDFAAEVVFSIDKFQHYGVFKIAFADSNGSRKIELKFSKGDDRVQRCEFSVQEAPGMVKELLPFDKVTEGVMKLQLVYNKTKRTLSITLRNQDGGKLYEAKDVPFTTKANFDSLQLTVNFNKDKISEISYFADKNCIFWRAHVGNEGGYAYMIEGRVNSVSLKTR